ncbi:aldehyde dehydrogenase [Variovorax sp. J22R24]|uniref:aldehyde dehydrogenase n=1 Tax=Variovorax gracilis TaxID=3053502 RepID=UPI00257644DB|nr:aldehyde dehydrogenase [Variovorax sp. J22R24]MDM0106576.1 aldehyde dehydrogenase [Variovorax sp. J22R24]
MTVITHSNFINGEFSASQEFVEVSNPANHEVVSRAPESQREEVDLAVSAARAAQRDWAHLPAIERAGFLRQVSAKVRASASELARLVSQEQGKVLSLAALEVAFAADYLDYMAEWARRIEGEVITSDRRNETILLLRKPLGVVAGILPWNFPFLMIVRKMAPALVTGNTIVIKPSEETPNSCFAFAKLVAETDLPRGVFNVVGGSASVGSQLSSHVGVDMVSFTGSVRAGQAIMAAAAPNLTKLNLELGGKAPTIVLDDADIDLAVSAIRSSRIINTGQACSCADRVYVQRRVADEFTDKLGQAMKATKFGDPFAQSDLEMGPLINRSALDRVDGLVRAALEQGATAVTGGARADVERGFHYQPTVLANCNPEMRVMREEIFGPVLPVQVVENVEQAIALANDSEYGLTSSIYTRSLSSAMLASRELSFGETYVNREHFEALQGYHAGVRKSGIGGADGKHGLYDYTSTHVVYMQA